MLDIGSNDIMLLASMSPKFCFCPHRVPYPIPTVVGIVKLSSSTLLRLRDSIQRSVYK